jgi:hypothetical protein
MQQRNILSGPYLDRAAHLRDDPAWFAEALGAENSRVIAVWNTRNLITLGDAPRAAFVPLQSIPPAQRNASDLILLGRFDGIHYFAHDIEAQDAPSLFPETRFEDLRVMAALLPPD